MPTNLTSRVSGTTSHSGGVVSQTRVLTQSTTHRFDVGGRENMVDYGQLERAQNASDTGAPNAAKLGQAAIDKSSFGLTMEPGAKYTINASGEIDKNGKGLFGLGGNVSPDSKTDDGSTRLQMFVSKDGQVVDRLNYKPGMEIDASRYPAGSKLHAAFQDRNKYDNDGKFRLEVTQTETKAVQTNVIGKDAVEQVRPKLEAEKAPPQGTVPKPSQELSRMPVDKALSVDQENGIIRTHGGYQLKTSGDSNLLTVTAPDGRSKTNFNFRDGRWYESDGTVGKLDAIAKDGNFVLGDGSTFAFKTGDRGQVTGLTVASDRARVEVDGFGGPTRPTIGSVKDDGLQWRVKRFEDTERTSFHQAGWGDAAKGVADDKQMGWYATWKGQDLGLVEGRWEDGRFRNRANGTQKFVDESLRPPLGSKSYELALNNAMYSELGQTSGALQARAKAYGYDIDPTRAREAALEYMQPRVRQIGELNLLNRLASEYPGLHMEQLYGGMPSYFPQAGGGYAALAQLQAILQMQSMWSNMALPPRLFA